MFSSWVCVAVMIAGALVYALSTNNRVAEMGRLMFFCGLFVICWVSGQHFVRVAP